MVQKMYSLMAGEGVDDDRQNPTWVNQPMKPNRDDPYWDYGIPNGPRSDPGSETGGVGSGFPTDMKTPQLVFKEPLGKLPFPDAIERGRGELILSDRAKVLFETLDRDAFEFVAAETTLHNGSAGPKYWLADVVRFLDALDEKSSKVHVEKKIIPQTGRVQRRTYCKRGAEVYRRESIGGAHVFRLLYLPSEIICDEDTAAAIRRQKLFGLDLVPAGVVDAR